MGLNCGIVGLPNVGKSTIFSALSSVSAKVANYPFCTIEPNLGIIQVPDERLYKIADIIKPEEIIPATVEFVDIAGLVQGASLGEGLGNQFLGHIRDVTVLMHIVRCFEDPDVSHPYKEINPSRDIEVINIELALADLQTIEKRLERNKKLLKNQDKNIVKQIEFIQPTLHKITESLKQGKSAKMVELSSKEKNVIKDLHLLTMKKVLYVCNIDENSITLGNKYLKSVEKYATKEEVPIVEICGKVEAEIAQIDKEEEKRGFLDMMGIVESGLKKLIKSTYHLLELKTFFTENGKEVRAWTFPKGAKAPEAAGLVHSDFQKGFIKAEVCHCEDLFKYGSFSKIKEKGKLRIEGKNYKVEDGDIIKFIFST